MTKGKKQISGFIIAIILALTLSSSFCLKFLTMSALAAEMPTGNADTMTSQVRVVDACCPEKATQADQQFISQSAHNSTNDCCLNRDDSPRSASATIHFDQNLISTIATPTTIMASATVFGSYQLLLYLPPPQADALSSVVKRE